MKKTASQYYKEKLEERRRIAFPLAVAKGKELDKLDRLIETRNEPGLMAFWGNPKNLTGLDALKFLSEELKKEREVTPDDLEFISSISKETKNLKFDLSGSIGILFQVTGLCEELNKKDLSEKIKMPLFFWAYLTLIESCINDLSDIFFEIAEKKADKMFQKDYEKALAEGEHLMFGTLRSYAIKWNFTKKESMTFLNKTNLRNQIAHANIYYDSERKKILIKGNKFMEVEDFVKEFSRIFDFFKELIFQMNNQEEDLVQETLKLTKGFSREFLKICRSGEKRKKWEAIVFDWEKEEKEDST
jgi:hypothetical protein